MTDQLPAKQIQNEIIKAFDAGSPMQRMFGETWNRLGGLDFMQEWAEDNPSDFVRLMLAVNPAAQDTTPGGNQVNVNIHPGLVPGPLDIKDVTPRD